MPLSDAAAQNAGPAAESRKRSDGGLPHLRVPPARGEPQRLAGRRTTLALGLAIGLALVVGVKASQAGDTALRNCSAASQPARTIAACTSVLARSAGAPARFRAMALGNRGNAYSAVGDHDRALADYDEAIRVDPTFATIYYNRGLGYATRGDYDRAIIDFTAAIRLDPGSSNAYNNRGYSLKLKGELDRALADFTTAVQLDPNNASAYVNRGDIFSQRGDQERARADLEAAARIDPKSVRSGERRDPTADNSAGRPSPPARSANSRAEGQRLVLQLGRLTATFDAGKYNNVLAQVPPFLEVVRRRPADDLGPHLLLDGLKLLASSHILLDQPADAEPYVEELTALAEKLLLPEHSGDFAQVVDFIGKAYARRTRFVEAEALYQRQLAVYEKAFGSGDPHVAYALNELQVIHTDTGRYAEAEMLGRRSLAILEKTAQRDPQGFVSQTNFAGGLANLAALYQILGRYDEAEPLASRAFLIATGLTDISSSDSYIGDHYIKGLILLASLYSRLDRQQKAEALYRQGLSVLEERGGASRPELAIPTGLVLFHLADLYRVEGRLAEAEPLFRRGIGLWEKVLGSGAEDSELGRARSNLATLLRSQGRYAEARLLYGSALAAAQSMRADSVDVPDILNNMAELSLASGHAAEALDISRRSVDVMVRLMSRDTTAASTVEMASLRPYFEVNLKILRKAMDDKIVDSASDAEAFSIAQWANQSTAAAALNQMSARFGSGGDVLARLVRELQDTAGELRAVNKALVGEISKTAGGGDARLSDTLHHRLTSLEQRLGKLNGRLAAEFPGYAALTSPKPLAVDEVRKRLGADEALVFLLTGEEATQVFVVTDAGLSWHTVGLGGAALTEKISEFRRGLEVGAVRRGLARLECSEAEATKRGLSRAQCGEAVARDCAHSNPDSRGLARIECVQASARVECSDAVASERGLSRVQCGDAIVADCLQTDQRRRGLARAECDSILAGRRDLFDLAGAHQLYVTLLGPVEALIEDKRHLLIVPSGALTALPFHLLVTDKPALPTPALDDQLTAETFAPYREAAWLLKRQAVSVLPSVPSLRALRVLARGDRAAKPMIGFADPVFDPDAERASPATAIAPGRQVIVTRGYAEFWKGGAINRAELAKALPRLQDTADEVNAVAARLGAQPADIFLRAAASETEVKRAALADYRVVYFATHGLVAGDVNGLAEPALALSLPARPSDTDDGLLTASEVAHLKLNADWVVLSACNTIAGDKPGAEALSGLARAFFYAGARALMVSHWAVDSRAAVRLTTSTFEIIQKTPSIGRAEALRRAMLDYLADQSTPTNAYPAFWAPMAIIGEGAAR
jgi:tetratricopeptide (TPR) repeat protein/CHAT domain-containing protein